MMDVDVTTRHDSPGECPLLARRCSVAGEKKRSIFTSPPDAGYFSDGQFLSASFAPHADLSAGIGRLFQFSWTTDPKVLMDLTQQRGTRQSVKTDISGDGITSAADIRRGHGVATAEGAVEVRQVAEADGARDGAYCPAGEPRVAQQLAGEGEPSFEHMLAERHLLVFEQ